MSACTCTICGGPNNPARAEIGYTHCTSPSCVGTWRNRRVQEKGLALVLMHKQGLAWINKTDVPKNDMKRAGGFR